MFSSARRRASPRHHCYYFAHFRRADAGLAGPSGLCVTKDLSHDGIYFIVFDPTLREKMQLLLKFSYHERRVVKEREYLVEIVRVNALFARRCGIGARLIFEAPVRLHRRLFVPDGDLTKSTGSDADLARIDLYV